MLVCNFLTDKVGSLEKSEYENVRTLLLLLQKKSLIKISDLLANKDLNGEKQCLCL